MPKRNMHAVKQKTLEAIKLFEDIQKIMKDCGIESNYPKLEELSPNPFYHQISEDNALVVEYYYGLPSTIYTPLGYIKITGSYTSSGMSKEEINKILEDKLNLKCYKEEEYNHVGVIGGWYTINGDEYTEPEDKFWYDEGKSLFKEYLDEYIKTKNTKEN